MTTCNVNPIGTICNNDNGAWIEILPEYRPALQALDGFSHINVIWWFSECDNEAARAILEAEQPYKNAPGIMGIFATRSPARPNPLALTAAEVLQLDLKNGIIRIDYTDANDGTPVLDIKPYTPSMDRWSLRRCRNGAGTGQRAGKNLRTLRGRMNLIFSRNIPFLTGDRKTDSMKTAKIKTQPR